MIKRAIGCLLLWLALGAPAFAASNGELGAGHVLGNPTASQAPPTDADPQAIFNQRYCTTNNVLFGTSAASTWGCVTVGTGLAMSGGNIAVGVPPATTLGGIESIVSLSHNWIAYIDTSGVPHQSQPAFSDVSGALAPTQLPTTNANTVIGNFTSSSAQDTPTTIPSCPDSTGNHLNYVNGTGITCGTSSATGNMVLLTTLTAASSASVTDVGNCGTGGGTGCFTATYSSYLIIFQNVVPATASSSLEIQAHSGGAFQATSYVTRGFEVSSSTAIIAPTTFIGLANADTAAATPGYSGKVIVSNPSQTAAPKTFTYEGGYAGSGPIIILMSGGGYWNGGNGAVDGFQVLFSSGNITSGVVKIYGII